MPTNKALPSKQLNGHGALRAVLEAAFETSDFNRGELTVLSAQVDPYRLDTPSGHRDGAWAAQQLARDFGRNRRTHWRGLHYAIVARGNVRKPDGEIYRNTDDDWTWLMNVAGKAARWLGYIPFERIIDARNAEPIVHRKASLEVKAYISVGIDVAIPSVEDIEPHPGVNGFVGRQAFSFVIFGEKASLEEVLLPVARAHEADLYLPSGEISDTLIHRIAKDAAEDGRPLVMITVSDCDPAGYQMPVSIGRKLQAFRDLLFPDCNLKSYLRRSRLSRCASWISRRRRSRKPNVAPTAGARHLMSSKRKLMRSPLCSRSPARDRDARI